MKFNLLLTKLWLRMEKKSLKFMQSKGDNYSITDDTLMKLPMYNHDIAMYPQYKFHDISSTIGYLVMAEEGQKH